MIDDEKTIGIKTSSSADDKDMLAHTRSEAEEYDFDFILDIPLEFSVELGKSKTTVDNLLQLIPGSVIELDRLAGEPLDIYINEKLVANGEVVVQNEMYGIRLTDIISPMERTKKDM